MCAIVEEYAEKKAKEAAKEAAKKAAKETVREMAFSLLKMGKLTVEEIVSSVPLLSREDIIELQKSL